MSFSDKLYDLRISKGISQKELADRLGVAQSSINYWEKGQRDPSITIVKKIAEFFGVSLDYLMEMNNTDEPQTIAAHFEGDEFTEEELDEIRQFAQFVKMKRYKDAFKEESAQIKPFTIVQPQLNAAHADDYENAPEELKKKEEDIMDDENF